MKFVGEDIAVLLALILLALVAVLIVLSDKEKSKKQMVAGDNGRRTDKMKYCSHCGKEIVDEAVVCPNCGCAVGTVSSETDVPSTGLNVLSFLMPVVGLILYLVYHEKSPQKAGAIGKWALIGVGVVVALYILNIILFSALL